MNTVPFCCLLENYVHVCSPIYLLQLWTQKKMHAALHNVINNSDLSIKNKKLHNVIKNSDLSIQKQKNQNHATLHNVIVEL